MGRSGEPDDVLAAVLRAVREDEAALRASPAVETRLRAAVRARAANRRRAPLHSSVVAAVLTMAVSAAVWSVRESPGGDQATAASPAADTAVEATEFFPLFYSRVPANAVHIVRLEVSREALASFGVEAVDPAGAPATVLADVIVGDDGLARAIRFVEPSTGQFEEQRP